MSGMTPLDVVGEESMPGGQTASSVFKRLDRHL